MKKSMIGSLFALGFVLAPTPSSSEVFTRPPDALKRAFPKAERIDARDVLLTDDMVRRIEKLARTRPRDRLVTFYTAVTDGRVAGHAVVHSHIVRTKRETFLLVFEPDGRIRHVDIIAFFEPLEYMPTERWLAQLRGKSANHRLTVGDDVAAISGATLSARGIAEEARWLLAALRETTSGAVAARE